MSEISPWETEFRQTQPGKTHIAVAKVQCENIAILDFKSNLGLHQMGSGPKGCVTIGVPICGGVEKWKDVPAKVGALLSFGSGTSFEGLSPHGFQGLTFALPEAFFSDLCKKLGVVNSATFRQFGVISSANASRRRSRIAAHVLESLAANGAPFTPQYEDEIASALVLSMTDDDAQHDDKSTPARRAKARQRAIEVMEYLAPEAARISDICAQSGSSWRTLNRAFLEYFGFGPKVYFEHLRLTKVRDELVQFGPEMPIVDVANRWGFWHMGKFARDYRRLFHELPSETRARGKWNLI
ncbi:helix-turn-helix domain-containing protein [uncultured Shimia sp.]|uniref:AraC family transcriptional regulator n=1 Tax=uncultured Shimia sp. TaxID=573152 RepID=UPI00260D339F|nr:helix-turn-helix domain-containing protein [uncultured Shimia sp.]